MSNQKPDVNIVPAAEAEYFSHQPPDALQTQHDRTVSQCIHSLHMSGVS